MNVEIKTMIELPYFSLIKHSFTFFYIFADPPPPFHSASAPSAVFASNENAANFVTRYCACGSNFKPDGKGCLNMCGKVCVKLAQMLTFMLVLSTFILLVMVYFMPSAITSIINTTISSHEQPSFSNPSEDSWLPSNFQTWTSQEAENGDFNQTLIEGKQGPLYM